MAVMPHADGNRPTEFGRWMTRFRLLRRYTQQQVAVMLANRFGVALNLGRVCELEKGEIVPSSIRTISSGELVEALRDILDPDGPPPPTPMLAPAGPKIPGSGSEDGVTRQAA